MFESPGASPGVVEAGGSPTCDVLLAQELNQRAGAQYKEGNYDGAVELYTVAMRSGDVHKVGLDVLYSNRSAALLRSGRTQPAIDDAREAVRLGPKSPKAWNRLGTAMFYAQQYLHAGNAYRQQFVLQPGSGPKKNLISAICSLNCCPTDAPSNDYVEAGAEDGQLDLLLKCAGIADRFVHLSVLLQLAGLAKCERLKGRFLKTAMDIVLAYGSLAPAQLDLHCCPRGSLQKTPTAALYAKRIGGSYDTTHPLTVAAVALSNFAIGKSGVNPAAQFLNNQPMLDALYKLAGETCWCRKAQYHVAVAYRSLVEVVSRGGRCEVMSAIAGSVPEGLAIVLRNAKENGWSAEEQRLQVMLNAVLRHPSHPEQQVPAAE